MQSIAVVKGASNDSQVFSSFDEGIPGMLALGDMPVCEPKPTSRINCALVTMPEQTAIDFASAGGCLQSGISSFERMREFGRLTMGRSIGNKPQQHEAPTNNTRWRTMAP
jgi:hypothetical protein